MSGSLTKEELQGICDFIHFKRFDILRADQAYILFKAKMIQANVVTIPNPKFGGNSLELVCIKFTTRGRQITNKMEKSIRGDEQKLGLDKDPYLSLGPGSEHMYLMHERRLWHENDGDNQQKLVDCYAIGPEVVSAFMS